VRVNPPLRDIFVLPDTSVHVTVPGGFTPGPYQMLVTNPGGETDKLHNGFRACERRSLIGTLEPVLDIASPEVTRKPVMWRMTLEGDEVFFGPKVRHEAVLRLPALPSNLESRFEPGDGSGRMAIELHLTPLLDSGEVVLIGDDPTALTVLWDEAMSEGGCALQVLDNHTYGDVVLEVYRTPGSGSPQWSQLGDLPGDIIGPAYAPVRYRYDFSAEGVLTEARAWGPDVDLVIQAVGEDKYRCETVDTVSVVETLGELCEESAATHPELAFACHSMIPARMEPRGPKDNTTEFFKVVAVNPAGTSGDEPAP